MKLFFSLFEKKKDEKGKNEKKKQRKSAKTLASAFIMLLLISSTFSAGYAAAYSIGNPLDSYEKALNSIGHSIKEHAAGLIGVGLIVTGIVLTVAAAGTDAPATAPLIYAGMGLIGLDWGSHELDKYLSNHKKQTTTTGGSERNANETNVVNGTDNPDAQKIVNDANQKAYQAIQELGAKLRSDFIEYASTSNSGNIFVHIYGPSSIYGFSAFPVQIRLKIADAPISLDVVHLQEVRVYVITKNGQNLWARTWYYANGSQGIAPGQEVTYTTILKGPDPLLYNISQAISSGQITRELYNAIWNASTSEFEIHVYINAEQEAWKTDPNATSESDCQAVNGKWLDNKCWVFDKMIPLQVDAETTSAWKHVTGVADVASITDGMYGSLPIKFLMTDAASKWAVYQSRYAGAISDFMIVTAASPVHVLNSTAQYRFVIAPNPGYFDPAKPNITDDYRFAILRVIEGGRMELADTTTGNFGTLTQSKELDLTAHYTDAPGTLDYHALGLVYAYVVRSDGTKIPVWLAAEPQISVLQNLYVAIADQDVKKLIDDFKKNDTAAVKGEVKALISGLQQKIEDTNALLQKAKGMNNDKAAEYAEKAISEYRAAIDDLNKAADTGDYQMFLNYLNAAKKHEQAGDYYRNAARKQLDGDAEQAAIDAQKGDELSNLASQYEPGFNLSGLLGGDSGKKVLAALIIAIILAGAIYIFIGNKRLAALVFFISLILLLLAFGAFSGTHSVTSKISDGVKLIWGKCPFSHIIRL